MCGRPVIAPAGIVGSGLPTSVALCLSGSTDSAALPAIARVTVPWCSISWISGCRLQACLQQKMQALRQDVILDAAFL